MKSTPYSMRWTLGVFTILLFTLSACGSPALQAPTDTPTPQPPTPTPVPPKTLVVCLADEPTDLYLYGDTSRAKWSVLEALYDGPLDTIDFEPSAVILSQIPSLENGGVSLRAAAVSEGDPVANVSGDIVALKKGVRVFPAGCTSPDCAIEWDGTAGLELVQMVADFTLIEGVAWSDGEALSAEDSVFSYQVSADVDTLVTNTNLNRTLTYTAIDERTVQWVGKPGFLTLNPATFYWLPLPQHTLASLTPEQMLTDPMTTRQPLGWGAYMLDEWVSGEHIRMVKNPHYFRAAEGLPYFDIVEYRFISAIPEADPSLIVTGDCDIIDTSAGLESQIQPIRQLEEQGQVKTYFGMGPEWEGLFFGIKPSSYDDVYNPYEDRQDIFGDVRVRQAIAYCVNREDIKRVVTLSQSEVPVTFLPPSHPLASTETRVYPHDPERGNQLLDEAGWLDVDGNPSTPRVSQGVANIFNNTPLSLNYYATESSLHTQTASLVVESLAECGISVTPTFVSVADLYAAGPEGRLFGRNFDLAELAWSNGRQPPCFLFSSTEIPKAKNNWLGTRFGGVNITGFANEEFDAACTLTLSAGLDQQLLQTQANLAQQILMEEVPAIPLFFHVKAMASRPDLCGLSLDTTSRSGLKDIESLFLSEGSCPEN